MNNRILWCRYMYYCPFINQFLSIYTKTIIILSYEIYHVLYATCDRWLHFHRVRLRVWHVVSETAKDERLCRKIQVARVDLRSCDYNYYNYYNARVLKRFSRVIKRTMLRIGVGNKTVYRTIKTHDWYIVYIWNMFPRRGMGTERRKTQKYYCCGMPCVVCARHSVYYLLPPKSGGQ